MQRDVQLLLDQQAAWQLSRAKLRWGEKLRQAVALRHGLVALRKRPVGGGSRVKASAHD
jgi:hypothetical protein